MPARKEQYMSIDRAIILARLEEVLKGYLGKEVDLSLIAAIAQVVTDQDEVPPNIVRVPNRPMSSTSK